MKKRVISLAIAVAALLASPVFAEDFHGYDPATFDGGRLGAIWQWCILTPHLQTRQIGRSTTAGRRG